MNLLKLSFTPYLNLTCSVKDIAALNCNLFNDQLLVDITKECFILGITFNPNWSLKRLQQFHQNNIKVIMLSEAQEVEDITYPVVIEVPKEYKLLDTAKAVFLESKKMSHCLYTNYQIDLKNGSYVAIRSDKYNATIGLRLNKTNAFVNSSNITIKNSWIIDQIRGCNNGVVLEKVIIEAELAEVLAELNTKLKDFKVIANEFETQEVNELWF